MTGPPRTISFPNGSSAVVLEARRDISGREIVSRLGLPEPRGTLVVIGSTVELEPSGSARVADAMVRGVARVALAGGLTVVTGATDAGIFAILGAALAGRSAPLIGVAPAHLVSWPGGPPRHDGVALEPHHSHFVLVDGDAWGHETAALLGVAAALGAVAPSAAVLCGGGAVSRDEALGNHRAGRELVVIAGSGRLADELGQATGGPPSADVVLAEIVAGGRVTVCPPDADGFAIGDAVLAALAADAGWTAGRGPR